MAQKTVCYSLRKLTSFQRTKFQREMYGFKDISNHGKYTYRRPGLMDSIKHKKIYYSSLRVSEKDLEKVLKVLKKHNVEIHISGSHGH
jgi:hypothetical protein